MSGDNVEVVRRYLEKGLKSVSPEELPTWVVGFWESDGDYYPVRGFPEARPCHGREEIVSFLTQFRAAWEGYGFVVKNATGIGDDRVFVHGRIEAEGARAARSWTATSTTAAGSGTDGCSGSRIT